MLTEWDTVTDDLCELVDDDLRRGDEPSPMFAAFRGTEPLLFAWLRPFPCTDDVYNRYHPVIEILAAALPLGPDRIALALPGRAWSLDDPIVPVTEDGDLRQRVLAVVTADGRDRRAPVLDGWVLPFDVDADHPWGEPLHSGPGEAPLADILRAAASQGRRWIRGADRDGIIGQMERCVLLGHLISVPPATRVRLGLTSNATLCGRW